MHVTLSVSHGALELVDDCGVCVQTAEDGTVTISGTLANLNAALAAGVMFIPDANYNGADALHISVTDAEGGTSARNVALALTPVNDAPVVDSDDASVNYTLGDAGVAVDSDISLADIDSATLQSATVRIDNLQNGDVLSIGDPGTISWYYDSDAGALVLSGVASVEDYQTALRSITFQNNNTDPFDGRPDHQLPGR